jgi:hypothetical protein
MSQPTRSSVHVDSVLTNISIAYLQDQNNYVASKVFPVIPVDKQSDVYFTYPKNAWLRDEAQRRAPASESAGSGYGVSTDSYSADVWAFHMDVPDQVRKNADSPLSPDSDATKFVTTRLLLRKEKQWVSDYFTTSVWGTDSTPSNLWSNYSTSDPTEDIEAAKQTILTNTGFMPNTLVLGYPVFRQLKNHPDFRDRIKYTTSDNITAQLIARMLEVENVYVAMSTNATNIEGETAVYALVHGKHALLCYTNPNPGLLAPSAGYTFAWTGVGGAFGSEVGVSRIPMPLVKADRIEAEMAWDNKVVASDLGYFFNGAVS